MEEVSCYPNELEVQIYQLMEDLPIILSQASGQDVWAMLDALKAFFLGIVTLESGVQGSISSLLLLSMVWRILLSPLLGFFLVETGGILNRVAHIWEYDDLDHRTAVRLVRANIFAARCFFSN